MALWFSESRILEEEGEGVLWVHKIYTGIICTRLYGVLPVC